MVVAAYGLILPQWVLDVPRLGCLNIHASLLPRWRGAAPIHRAIEAGDAQTGVTIMQMDAGLDTGDMLLTERDADRAATPPHRCTTSSRAGRPPDRGGPGASQRAAGCKRRRSPPRRDLCAQDREGRSRHRLARCRRTLSSAASALSTRSPAPRRRCRARPSSCGARRRLAPGRDASRPAPSLPVDGDGIVVACGEGRSSSPSCSAPAASAWAPKTSCAASRCSRAPDSNRRLMFIFKSVHRHPAFRAGMRAPCRRRARHRRVGPDDGRGDGQVRHERGGSARDDAVRLCRQLAARADPADRGRRADLGDLATGFCVNLRFVVFSLHLRDYLMHMPRWRRLVNGFLTADMSYALFTRRYRSPPPTPEGPRAGGLPRRQLLLTWTRWVGSAWSASRWPTWFPTVGAWASPACCAWSASCARWPTRRCACWPRWWRRRGRGRVRLAAQAQRGGGDRRRRVVCLWLERQNSARPEPGAHA